MSKDEKSYDELESMAIKGLDELSTGSTVRMVTKKGNEILVLLDADTNEAPIEISSGGSKWGLDGQDSKNAVVNLENFSITSRILDSPSGRSDTEDGTRYISIGGSFRVAKFNQDGKTWDGKSFCSFEDETKGEFELSHSALSESKKRGEVTTDKLLLMTGDEGEDKKLYILEITVEDKIPNGDVVYGRAFSMDTKLTKLNPEIIKKP